MLVLSVCFLHFVRFPSDADDEHFENDIIDACGCVLRLVLGADSLGWALWPRHELLGPAGWFGLRLHYKPAPGFTAFTACSMVLLLPSRFTASLTFYCFLHV